MRLRGVIVTLLSLIVLAGITATIVTHIIARRVSAQHPPVGAHVAVDGGRLHLIERPAAGAGAPVTIVLIHGASANARDPLFALERHLPQGVPVIAIDRPGHGWSDRPGDEADASPARQADLIAQALRARGVSRAVLVGHSLGGIVALTLALDHPDLVAGMMLLSPVSHPWPGGIAWYYHAASHAMVGRLFSHTIAVPVTALLLDSGIEAVFAPQPPAPEYRARSGVELLLRPGTFRANAQDVAGLYDFVLRQQDRYRSIRVPVTVITGDTDSIVSPTIHSRALGREIEGARLIVLPGVGHEPHYADPALVGRELMDLVARTGGDRGKPTD